MSGSASAFGQWTEIDGLPAFRSVPVGDTWDPITDPPTTRRWIHVGNRRITLVADTEGRSGLWDEFTGCDWLVEPRPRGTGVATVTCGDGVVTSDGAAPLFGPTFARTCADGAGARLERTVLCPEGEQPWVLIRVDVTNTAANPRAYTVAEDWEVRSHRVNLELGPPPEHVPGGHRTILLEALGGDRVQGSEGLLTVSRELDVPAGETRTVWFRCGLDDGVPVPDPAGLYRDSLAGLRERLPSATAEQAPEAGEIAWHAALLSGGACADGVYGGHTLNQGSVYAFRLGSNCAARDPLQHALPLVYTEPDLALSVLRNVCAWATPDGDLPYGLDGDKKPWTSVFRPSDQNLWALWLAAEYAAATGDLGAFAEPLGQGTLAENLRRQFRFFVDVVGVGENGHVRILNADWNDLVLSEIGVEWSVMVEHGESVLNSAMAAWVLPVYAGLCERLGDEETAGEVRELGETLRRRVASEWNGHWFRRAYGPGRVCVGDEDLWLEVQPWAILCGAATAAQSRALLSTIDRLCRKGSPLGARVRGAEGTLDIGMGDAIWYSINMTLIWAAARLDPELAWDEWRRMTLAAHQRAYPEIWGGTLSGPDAYLSPESERPGETWALAGLGLAMQAYPVANLHSHSQPLLAYLRLLGVAPTAGGTLTIGAPSGRGASFDSRVLRVRPDGTGETL
ncbi:GH36-type glycosyl hydrolase domain-containing protein [Nocardia sp. NPDC020380]|uniref:GH36-type glycosyl hydrolase domain-containing protein n=1 Tax=Nocardia sp. NPDC020380 TaxID=3364309 RepID=UPI00378CACC4